LLRRRQLHVADELVWVASALYLAPFAVALYARRGRASRVAPTGQHTAQATHEPDEARAHATSGTALALLSGGGASAVAHLVAVPLVISIGWTIAGMDMWPMILVIAVLAIAMVALYVRVTGAHADSAGTVTIGAAVVAAVITVSAFDVGMVGWMVLLHLNNLMPPASEGTFWFLMQLGVVVGLLTGYPVVRWLLRREEQSALPKPA
ncbi:DUF4396 domain-containing protein, partial [Nocardioides sp.]|uniref:DUF4396 domain-containing protein n=1 Tax=Nocardioides sp. TaxID=35761 RepID=UPI002B269DB0